MSICIPKELRDKFIRSIKDGSLDINKLADEPLTENRRAEFEKIFGKDYGKTANTLFEKGLVHADQQAGIISAIKAIGLDPKAEADFIKKTSEINGKLYKGEQILRDAREAKLKVGISEEQTKTLVDLSKKMDELNPGNRKDIKNLGDLTDELLKNKDLTPEQKTHLEDLKKELNRSETPEEIEKQIKLKVQGGDEDIGSEVSKLARSFVEQGITNPEKLVDAVHDVLKKSISDITPREVMDAISGYGKFRELSKNEIDIKLADLKGQMQNLGKLEDMEKGKAPSKSGVQHHPVSEEQKILIKKVNEAKIKYGFNTKDSLASYKEKLSTKIAELQTKIDNGDFSKNPKVQKNKIYDAETQNLKDKLKELKQTIRDKQNEIKTGDKKLTKESLGKMQGVLKKVYGKDIPPDIQAKIDGLKTLYKDSNMVDQKLGTSAEFVNAKNDFQQYVNSLHETPALRSIANSLGGFFKNSLIALKTGVKVATITPINSAIELVNRRIANGKIVGDVNIGDKINAVKANLEMYAKTKSGHISFLDVNGDDSAVFGTNKYGHHEDFGGKENIAKGESVGGKALEYTAKGLNAVTRASKYFAINMLHKPEMAINSSLAFVDASDMISSRYAKSEYNTKGDNMTATEIFNDSIKEKPQTDLGKLARLRSQEEVFRILSINKSALANITTELKYQMNKYVPTSGDYLLPMATVPSNVISAQIENMGGGLGTGTVKMIKGWSELNALKKEGNEQSIEGVQAMSKIQDGFSTLTRTIGIMGAAAIVTSNLTKKDFFEDRYKNSFVKIGNFWLNTEIFGGGSAAISGMMLAKDGHSGMLEDYATETENQVKKSPLAKPLDDISQQGIQAKINSFLSPTQLNDVEKSLREGTANPVFFGTMIRTEKQKKQDDADSGKKSAATKVQNAKNKAKKQTIF